MRALRASLSIRISPTALSSSVCIPLRLRLALTGETVFPPCAPFFRDRIVRAAHVGAPDDCVGIIAAQGGVATYPNVVYAIGLDDSLHCDYFPAAHDEGPRLALGAGDLGVDKHVLDLLPPPGKSVARPPASYLKACELGLDPPVPPANRALERDRATLEPGAVVLTDELNAVAEIESLRADGRGDQLREGRLGRGALLQGAEEVLVGGRMNLTQERQDPFADEAARRVAVRAVHAVGESVGAAVGHGLVAPERQERSDDAVFALRLDPGGAAARDEPVEDRLDLIGGRVAGGAQPVGREAVTNLAQLLLRPSAAAVDDLGAHQLAAKARVFLGLLPAQTVVDVKRRDAIAQLAQEVPGAGRVGAAGDEHCHISGRNQLEPTDVILHA